MLCLVVIVRLGIKFPVFLKSTIFIPNQYKGTLKTTLWDSNCCRVKMTIFRISEVFINEIIDVCLFKCWHYFKYLLFNVISHSYFLFLHSFIVGWCPFPKKHWARGGVHPGQVMRKLNNNFRETN